MDLSECGVFDLPRAVLIVCHEALKLALYDRPHSKLSPANGFVVKLCHPRV